MKPEDNKIVGWKPVEVIPIAFAIYCIDCGMVTRATNGHCLACGSHSIVHIEKLLNKQIEPSA